MAYTDQEMRLFTQIAYADLTKGYEALRIKYPGKTSFTIAELKQAAINAGVSKSRLSSLNCLSEEQLSTWKISGIHDTNAQNGFYGCIIETSPGNAVVGFRGSEGMGSIDNVINDWTAADLGLVNSTCTNQHAEVDRFLEKYKNQLNNYDSLAMTGHSLGGNLAEYATIVSGKYGLDDNIVQCLSMDGPGFSEEFINKYRDEIEKMSHTMRHVRWSFVGALLNDLPGVNYQYVQVENKGDDEYDRFTRHDTKYLVYDENGNLIEGEQDNFSKMMSILSEGVDHLPRPVGDVIISGLSAVWIGTMWVKEQLIQNGELTTAGKIVIAGALAIVSVIGVIPAVAIAFKVVFVTAVLILVSLGAIIVFEIVRDALIAAATFIAETVSKLYEWGKQKLEDLKNAIIDLYNSVKDWWNRNFNAGYKYANAHPYIEINTTKMSSYANQLSNISRRAKQLDSDMNSYYWQVIIEWDAIPRLAKLMRVGIGLDFARRLDKCSAYLRDTANDFDNAERTIQSNI